MLYKFDSMSLSFKFIVKVGCYGMVRWVIIIVFLYWDGDRGRKIFVLKYIKVVRNNKERGRELIYKCCFLIDICMVWNVK